MLAAIDYQVWFLLLWMGGTSFVALSLALSTLAYTSSLATAILFLEFLAVLVTLIACDVPLQTFQAEGYVTNDPTTANFDFFYVTSSYNTVYSTLLLGNTFVQFVVFFMPWFLVGQSFTNVLSTVQVSK